MPYIAQEIRNEIDPALDALVERVRAACFGYDDSSFSGILNYCFTRMIMGTICHRGVRYWKIALVSGLLTTVWSEFEKRIADPYEKRARDASGDVPEYEKFNLPLEEGR